MLPWFAAYYLQKREPQTTIQNISFWGCVCLMSNNIMGPGSLFLAGLWQESGWVLSLLFLLCACLWTLQSALFLGRAISRGVEGNGTFGQNVELSSYAKSILPPLGSLAVVLVILSNLFVQNIQSILVTTQTMDLVLQRVFGRTCALNLSQGVYECVTQGSDRKVYNSLYGVDYVISSGYMLSVAFCIPLALSSLDDNIGFQVVCFSLTLLQVVVYTLNFWAMGAQPTLLPAFGSTPRDFAPLIPQTFFNVNFMTTITALYSTKRPTVSATRVVHTAMGFVFFQVLLLSAFPALAFAIPGGSATQLDRLLLDEPPPGVWPATSNFSFVFPFVNVLTSAPVFSIFMQRNAESYFLPGRRGKALIAALFVGGPWVVALALYPIKTFSDVADWVASFTIIPMNLSIPLILFIVFVRREAKGVPPIKAGELAPLSSPTASGVGSGGSGGTNSDGCEPVFVDSPLGGMVVAARVGGGGASSTSSSSAAAFLGGSVGDGDRGVMDWSQSASINPLLRAKSASSSSSSLNSTSGIGGVGEEGSGGSSSANAPLTGSEITEGMAPMPLGNTPHPVWEEDIKPLPPWASKLISPYHYALALLMVSFILGVAAFALQINKAVVGEEEEGDSPNPEEGNNATEVSLNVLRALVEGREQKGLR